MEVSDLPYLLLFVCSPILYEFNRGWWIKNRARNGIKYYQVHLFLDHYAKSLGFFKKMLVIFFGALNRYVCMYSYGMENIVCSYT